MVATYIKKDYAQYYCVTLDVYSREIINMFFDSQVSGLVKNFDIKIYSDAINIKQSRALFLLPAS